MALATLNSQHNLLLLFLCRPSGNTKNIYIRIHYFPQLITESLAESLCLTKNVNVSFFQIFRDVLYHLPIVPVPERHCDWNVFKSNVITVLNDRILHPIPFCQMNCKVTRQGATECN